jgi:2-aminoadipate transaminase
MRPSSSDAPTFKLTPQAEALSQLVTLRDYLGLAVDPQIISLAGGLPGSDLLPVAALRKAFEAVIDRDGPRALQYSPSFSVLRQWIVGHMRQRGVTCSEEQIFLTHGAQQALALLSHLLLEPEGTAVTQAVTFTGVLQVTRGRGATVRPVAMDPQRGTDLAGLEAALGAEPRPSLAFVLTEFHNPMGVSLTEEQRPLVAALAERYGVPIVEDDPYSPLRFRGPALPCVKSFDAAGMVIHVGSFSKMLAPALRLGWIVADESLVPRLVALRESFDLEGSTLMQRAAALFLAEGHLEAHLARLTAANRERCEAMLDALQADFAGAATWSRPDGGLFVWLEFPEGVDTSERLPQAVAHMVAYIPGTAFAVDGGSRNALRLNFSSASPDSIREGIHRLAAVFLDR